MLSSQLVITMVKEVSLAVRNQAIGMLKAGQTQKSVAVHFGTNVRTVRRWWSRAYCGNSLENRQGRGRKQAIGKVPKIVIAKTLGKKMKSTRKISQLLKYKGFQVSHVTVHTYLRQNLGVKPYKPQLQPKLTEKQKFARLTFCKARKKWSINDWRNVLFSDESPFELYHSPNRQNDRVWTADRNKVVATEKVKFPGKLQVWGMMSYNGLSNLHIIPSGQTVTTIYYLEEFLKKTMMSAIHRDRETGTVTERKLVSDMSRAIFQQDGAPAHTSKKTQEWLRENFQNFWPKGIWPANSRDLSPTENLWSIIQTTINSFEPATNLKTLEKQLISAWRHISPEVLDKLIASMPEGISKCIQLKGGYIGK